MIHSKSKSTKIKPDAIYDENSSSKKKENVANGNNTTSDSANCMSFTKENLNLESFFDNNSNIKKISSLFHIEEIDENDDKIVNISKLDEDICSFDKKSIKNMHQTGESNSQLIEVNKNDIDKIINISNLDIHINCQNETENKAEIIKPSENANEKTNTNVNIDINANVNNQMNKTEEIKISELKSEADEAFKVKKKSFFDKISFRLKMIILIISLLLVLLSFTFIIFKIFIG
jgi:hypothetical protein